MYLSLAALLHLTWEILFCIVKVHFSFSIGMLLLKMGKNIALMALNAKSAM